MTEGAIRRYSKKRQAILDCLKKTDTHPTAEWIYEQLREQYPDLSLATVYRNLNQLKEAGMVRSMGVVNDHERFDGKTGPHSHVVCAGCGAIIDLDDIRIDEDMIAQAETATGYSISEVSLHFIGMCRDCRAAGAGDPVRKDD